MEWLGKMNSAIDYIEANIFEKVDYIQAANIACCSLSRFQNMFIFITDITPSEYVRRRRMALSAHELINGSAKIIDLSFKYGYESPAAFTRSFKAFHGLSPSEVRKCKKYVDYPRISFQMKIVGGHFAMDKFKQVLKTQFGVAGADITEVFGGSDDKNAHYKVTAGSRAFFLKVYDKSKVQTSQWTENIDIYMPILVWLNENTDLHGRIIYPYKTVQGGYCFEDDENIFLLFAYIEGDTAGKTLTRSQLMEAAEILASLHNAGNDIPFDMNRIKEDFSVPFCFSLEKFIAKKYASSPAYIKAILQPCLAPLMAKNEKVKSLSEKFSKMSFDMTLCHMDAHGYNLMQAGRLVLVDWEMAKYAPPELDLCVFTKPEYRDTFIGHYTELRPGFVLNNDLLMFYVQRRNIEDIWEFLNTIINNKQTTEQRQLELDLLSVCCKAINDPFYEL